MSGLKNLSDWCEGRKTGQDVFIDTAVDATISAVDGSIKGAVGSLATTSSIHIAAKISSETAKRVLKSSGPAVVAIGMLEVGKDLVDLGAGEIDGEEFCKKIVQNVSSTAGGWAGAEAGMALGSFLGPGGTIAGGIIGGVIGAFGVGSLFD